MLVQEHYLYCAITISTLALQCCVGMQHSFFWCQHIFSLGKLAFLCYHDNIYRLLRAHCSTLLEEHCLYSTASTEALPYYLYINFIIISSTLLPAYLLYSAISKVTILCVVSANLS